MVEGGFGFRNDCPVLLASKNECNPVVVSGFVVACHADPEFVSRHIVPVAGPGKGFAQPVVFNGSYDAEIRIACDEAAAEKAVSRVVVAVIVLIVSTNLNRTGMNVGF